MGKLALSATVVFFALTILALFYGRPIIDSDGVTYYATTLSVLRDHDFDLVNQKESFRKVQMIPDEETQKPVALYSGGFALLYAPFLWSAEKLGAWVRAFGEWRPYRQNAKFQFPHGFGIFLGSILYSFAGVMAGSVLLLRRYGTSTKAGVLIPLAVLAGTPLLFYTVTGPSFAHASDTFLTAVLFCLTLLRNPLEVGGLRLRNLLFGFLAAVSIFLRNNNVALVGPLALSVLILERSRGGRRLTATILEFLAGASPILALHAYYNWA